MLPPEEYKPLWKSETARPLDVAPKTDIRVHFTDFWHNFRPHEFWLHRLLSETFNVILDPISPELLIFSDSDYGVDHLRYSCLKVYYSHENLQVRPRLCDYSFAIRARGGKHQYFSNLVEEQFFQQVRSGTSTSEIESFRGAPKSKFCNFVYSNAKPQERIKFCRDLMQYKPVDCLGKVLNNHPPFDNHGYTYEKKLLFLKDYKFTIAFENASAANYTSEKIFHPFVVGSVPIYWGNPKVAELFNPKSFINCHEFDSFEDVIEWVKKVDTNEELFAAYQAAPPILPESPLAVFSNEFLQTRICEIGQAALAGPSVSQKRLYPLFKWSHYFRVKLKDRIIYTSQRLQEMVSGTSSRVAWRRGSPAHHAALDENAEC